MSVGSSQLPIVLAMRGTLKWKKALDGLAKHDDRDVNQVIERSLKMYAESIGYAEPIPPRLGEKED